MSGARPTASILVPVLNESDHLRRTAREMLDQDLDGGLEVLIVDGGSSDGSREIVEAIARTDARVRVLENPHRRTTHALNIGLQAARGDYIVRMDAHTHYPRDYVGTGIARLARGDADWVSGPQLPRGEGRWSSRIALALSTRLGIGGADFRNAREEIEVDSGFTGVWSRDTLLAHGGWDEGWPVNQDGELAARIRGAGGRIVCVPEMAARYVPRDSLRALARQYWRYGQYRAKTSRRHPASMRRSHVLPPGLVLTAAGAVLSRGRPARAARAALAVYAAAVAATTARAGGGQPVPAADRAALPLVFGTMHAAWGAGFLAGCVRFGPPLAALRRVLLR